MEVSPLDSRSAVRTGEELPVAALADYLRGKIESAESGIEVRQFLDGHSNLTYLLSCGDGRQYVLRRGPLGLVAPKAHDMAREYHVLQAISRNFPEAPRPYHLCENPEIIGAVFFVMEHRRGVIVRNKVPASFRTVPDHARLISEAFVNCLVRLHAVDVTQKELSSLGKPDGFLQRQVHGWRERWNRARTEDSLEMEALGDWLSRHLPHSPPAAFVHNDYKLDNVILRSACEIEAVLDWEMATIGDPLADVGLTLCYWAWTELVGGGKDVVPTLTSRPGWYNRDQFIEHYSERSGRNLSGIDYYEVLGMYKLAVILQQIYYRFRRGQTQDERFRHFDQRITSLARQAATLAEKRT